MDGEAWRKPREPAAKVWEKKQPYWDGCRGYIAKSGPNPKDVAVETEKSIFDETAWSDFAVNWTDGGCEWGEEMSQESRQSMEN